ncbi:MAG TPA: DUF1016 domain-containing protein, partial [bacterium]|nr:DUF1016 domain-containing protein [bacterium]
IVSKCKTITEALYYVQQTIENSWSRSVLVHQIESGLFSREGKSITNFEQTLPKPQSDLAQQTLKDPYVFDFLTMTKSYNELDLEKALIDHIAHERDFFIDLLFYHARLHSDIHKPMGVSEYQLTQSLPENLKGSLPSIEEIETELSRE